MVCCEPPQGRPGLVAQSSLRKRRWACREVVERCREAACSLLGRRTGDSESCLLRHPMSSGALELLGESLSIQANKNKCQQNKLIWAIRVSL